MTHEQKRNQAMQKWAAELPYPREDGMAAAFREGFDAGTESWRDSDAEADAEMERVRAMPIEDVEKELRDAGVDSDLFERATLALVKACKERNAALDQLRLATRKA